MDNQELLSCVHKAATVFSRLPGVAFSVTQKLVRVGWGKMSMARQSWSLEIVICMPKIRDPMVIRSTFLFPVGIGKVKLMTLLS